MVGIFVLEQIIEHYLTDDIYFNEFGQDKNLYLSSFSFNLKYTFD
jgi:hypothetical protein